MRGRQPSTSDDASLEAPFIRSRREPLDKAIDHEALTSGAKTQRSVQRDTPSTGQSECDKTAHASRPQVKAGGLESHRPVEGQLEHKSRDRQAKLQFRRVEVQPVHKTFQAPTKRSFAQRIAGRTDAGRSPTTREELKKTISGPIAVEPPQSIITPAFDAPISAVNAGERRVKVKYGQSTMSLPVTPSTTPLDIIRLAAEESSEAISPKNMIVVESYRQLGLERPLRRYEHVRDVLNSWDNDMQNCLLIVPSPTGNDDDLELSHVPKVQPVDTSVTIYHSQRPGHWDKRWVTLRTDGQIVVAKKDGGETSNICHLSDFDIYTPTARQLSKKIKPPRKTCLTVKSQQKSSMFISTVNFVHFFSTSDNTLAASWCKAVQEWRSWYLVHVMGNGQQDFRSPKPEGATTNHRSSVEAQPRSSNHGRPPNESRSQEISSPREIAPHGIPVRNRGPPPVSFPKRLPQHTQTSDSPQRRGSEPILKTTSRSNSEPEPFAATSLLGRSYTQRQKSQKSREANQNLPDPPPAMPVQTSQSNGLKRASSQRQKPKPLVDLTPQYREPPQHSRKGRGVIPQHIPAGGLVEIATSPEAALEVPSATTWQRPTTRAGDQGAGSEIQRSRTMRRDHSSGRPPNARQTSTSPEKGDAPFTSGLLAGSKGQGGMRTGRGVMTGDRQAKAPMLDVAEPSNYAPGSLLERVERHDGSPRPVIERAKRREVNATVGEGF